jgi:enoyl-CoA hydratase
MPVLVTEIQDRILKITLNRPEKHNTLNEALLDALSYQLKDAETNDAVGAILITGQGKNFCAGADINELAQLDTAAGLAFAQRGQAIFNQLETLGKPSLAAINGGAFGGGCELACAATLRIASKEASFSQPEIKLGLIPGYGGTQRLPTLIGKGRALYLCVTGYPISAEEALSYGLISEVIDSEHLLERAETILKHILTLAPCAISSVIGVINSGCDLPTKNAIDREAAQFGLLCGSKDKQEGVAAFVEKRPPKFTGK